MVLKSKSLTIFFSVIYILLCPQFISRSTSIEHPDDAPDLSEAESGVVTFYCTLRLACLFIFLYMQARLSRKGCPEIYSGVKASIVPSGSLVYSYSYTCKRD
jgi:hypothetical protein